MTPHLQHRRTLVVAGLWLAVGSWAVAGSAPAAANTAAGYQVIANQKNGASLVSRTFVADVFLKKASRWESGERALPVDLRRTSAVREAFSAGVLRRPVDAVRKYWMQRIFSGRDIPPPEVETDEAVVRFVASHPGAVGYVSVGAALAGTKRLEVR